MHNFKNIIILIVTFSSMFFILSLFNNFKIDYTTNKNTYITLTPALTEIVYALNAQDKLLAVTTMCDYPKEALKKPKVGNAYFINKEQITKLKPASLFAIKEQKPFIDDLKTMGIKIHYFSFDNIDDIFKTTLEIASITGHPEEARELLSKIKSREGQYKSKKRKKILYVVQAEPLITIGSKSFISDLIKKSGNLSVTDSINNYYPVVSTEYASRLQPDVIIVYDKASADYLKPFFKGKEFIVLNYSQMNIINRPSLRYVEALKYFSNF